MATPKIPAETRTEFNRGAAARIRREHKIPAVIYVDGEIRHLVLPSRVTVTALSEAFAHGGPKHVVIELNGRDQLALAKSVVVHPIRRTIEHIDLVALNQGNPVQVKVPVVLEGETALGTGAVALSPWVRVEAEGTEVPAQVVVMVEGLTEGALVTAAQLDLPAGTVMLEDPDTVVAEVHILRDRLLGSADHPSPRSDHALAVSVADGDMGVAPAVEPEVALDADVFAEMCRGDLLVPVALPRSESLSSFADALIDSGTTLSALTQALIGIQDPAWFNAGRRGAKATMSASDREFLARHAGFELPDDETLGQLEEANTARVLRDTATLLADALTGAEVAERLGIAAATVRDRKRDGALHAIPMTAGNRYPLWQFHGDRSLPHLEAVLRALPDDLHPLDVADYVTRPRDWLTLRGEPVSVRDWLIAGGDVDVVVGDAESADILA